MPFKKMQYTDKNGDGEDDDSDEEGEEQIPVVFPGIHFPPAHIHPDLAKSLTGKLPELRLKIRSTFGRINTTFKWKTKKK